MLPVNMYQAHLQEWQSGFRVPFSGQGKMRKACTEAKEEGGLASDVGTCITGDTPWSYHSVGLAEMNRIYFLEGKGGECFQEIISSLGR